MDIYANCALDTINAGGQEHRRPGGPACYCGMTARKLKFDVTLHTRFGADFDRSVLDGMDVAYTDLPDEAGTTAFRIDVRGAERDLYLENMCGSLRHEPSGADGVIVSPIMGEVGREALAGIIRDSGFVFVDPQGFLREADGRGMITLARRELELGGVSAAKASPAELEGLVGSRGTEGMRLLQKKGVGLVLTTDGADVSLLDGDRLYRLRLPDREIVDTTGIGDIFGATFACTMLREKDPIWALCFAAGSAQAALETRKVGLDKVPERGATMTNGSYFYNMLGFETV